MNALNLATNHKVVQAYYDAIKDLSTLHLFTEGAVSPAFGSLLRYGAHQYGWTLAEKYPLKRGHRHSIQMVRCSMISKSSTGSGKPKIRMTILPKRLRRNLRQDIR